MKDDELISAKTGGNLVVAKHDYGAGDISGADAAPMTPLPRGLSNKIDSRMAKDLANVIAPELSSLPKKNGLPPATIRGGFAEQRAQAMETTNPKSSSGIASPLTERATPGTAPLVARVYYDPVMVPSADGILTFEVLNVQSIAFVDATGLSLTVIYANEDGP